MTGQTEEDACNEELVARDLPEFLHILEEIRDKVPVVTQHVDHMLEVVASPNTSTENGISLLEVKVHLLLSSLINVTQLMLMKTEGQSINGCPPLLRLVEIRTVLEKLRPLDQKLRYQIDKLIRTAQTGITGAMDDPLRFRANPANMVSKAI
jgi:U3 small nucleolar ribonucleoprotein protein LCP5